MKKYMYDGMVCRRDTLDEYIVREVRGCYRHLSLRKRDVVLDVGANIGAFCAHVADSVHSVIGYEPDPENYKLCCTNTQKMDNVVVHNQAVISTWAKHCTLFINDMKNKGSHSIMPVRGRSYTDVSSVNFGYVLSSVKPTVVKMDVEGAEYDLILSCSFPGSVREIAIEFHLQKTAQRRQLPAVRAHLNAQGFVEKVPFTWKETTWHKVAFYQRKTPE